jgi:hypothetical protein
MCLKKKVRREGKERNNKGKTAREQNERKGNKHNLLYEHKETVQTVGIQSWKTGSLNNCNG